MHSLKQNKGDNNSAITEYRHNILGLGKLYKISLKKL